MKYVVFISLCLVISNCAAEEHRELDKVLDQVLTQVRTSLRDISKDGPTTAEEVIEHVNVRDILHHSVTNSTDRQVRVVYAIMSLNSIIEYLETGLNEVDEDSMPADYRKMKKTRKYLAEAYLKLEAKRKAEQDKSPKP